MSKSACRRRRETLAAEMRKKKLPRIMLQDIKHIYYFTGFSILFPGVKNRFDLLLDTKAGATLVVSAPLAKDAALHADEVVPVQHSFVRSGRRRDDGFARAIKAVTGQSESALRKAGAAVLPEISLMRRRKDKEEKEELRHLARLAGLGYDAAKRQCIAGRTELDLLVAAKAACIGDNKRDLFVSGDFVSGRRTLAIGGEATARKLNAGENVIIDLWLIANHYWSDTCRTFFVDGRSTERQESFLEMLAAVKRRAERSIRPGVKAAEIYRQMQDNLKKYGYTCPHHLGHGIGLDFWEPPFITADSPDVFQEDMAFTLEIGVYDRKHHGFRLEDNYFVTAGGVTRFTRFP